MASQIARDCQGAIDANVALDKAVLSLPSPARSHAASRESSRVKHAAGMADTVKVLEEDLQNLRAMYKKMADQNKTLRADARYAEELRCAAERRASLLEKKSETGKHVEEECVAGYADLNKDALTQEESDVLTTLQAEAAQASKESGELWKAILATVHEPTAQSLRYKEVCQLLAAKVEQERSRTASLWESLRQATDAKTFEAVARSASGGQEVLPVHLARRLFNSFSSSESETPRVGGAAPRSSSTTRTEAFLFQKTQQQPTAGRPRAASTGCQVRPPVPSSKAVSVHQRVTEFEKRPSAGGARDLADGMKAPELQCKHRMDSRERRATDVGLSRASVPSVGNVTSLKLQLPPRALSPPQKETQIASNDAEVLQETPRVGEKEEPRSPPSASVRDRIKSWGKA